MTSFLPSLFGFKCLDVVTSENSRSFDNRKIRMQTTKPKKKTSQRRIDCTESFRAHGLRSQVQQCKKQPKTST